MARDHHSRDLRRVIMNTSWTARIAKERWVNKVISGDTKLSYDSWKDIEVSSMISEIQRGLNPGRDYEAPKTDSDPVEVPAELTSADVSKMKSHLVDHLKDLCEADISFLGEDEWIMRVTEGGTEESYWKWRDEKIDYIAEGLSQRIGCFLEAAAESADEAPLGVVRSLFSFALSASHRMTLGRNAYEMDRVSKLFPEGLAYDLFWMTEFKASIPEQHPENKIPEICEKYEITGDFLDALRSPDPDEETLSM